MSGKMRWWGSTSVLVVFLTLSMPGCASAPERWCVISFEADLIVEACWSSTKPLPRAALDITLKNPTRGPIVEDLVIDGKVWHRGLRVEPLDIVGPLRVPAERIGSSAPVLVYGDTQVQMVAPDALVRSRR